MNDTPNSDKTTHFGYQEVPVAEKSTLVGKVFHSVAPKYDLMNDVVSLGTHRLIKRYTVELSADRSRRHQRIHGCRGTRPDH